MCKYVSCNLGSVGFMQPLTSAAKGRNRTGDSATLFFFLFQHSGQLLKKTWPRPDFSCIILMETFLLLPSSSWLWPPEQTDSDVIKKKKKLSCDGRKESVEHVSFQSLPSWTLCQCGRGLEVGGGRQVHAPNRIVFCCHRRGHMFVWTASAWTQVDIWWQDILKDGEQD